MRMPSEREQKSIHQRNIKILTSFAESRRILASWELLLIRDLIFLKDETTEIGTA